MPLITKSFNYSGQLQLAELPAGTTTLTMHIWGGAGGPGGPDSAGDGADGAAGHYVTVTDLDVSSYAVAKSIAVAVGGGGKAGELAGNANGGKNGQSVTQYSGGVGGSSGPVNVSGSGGGGGGYDPNRWFQWLIHHVPQPGRLCSGRIACGSAEL